MKQALTVLLAAVYLYLCALPAAISWGFSLPGMIIGGTHLLVGANAIRLALAPGRRHLPMVLSLSSIYMGYALLVEIDTRAGITTLSDWPYAGMMYHLYARHIGDALLILALAIFMLADTAAPRTTMVKKISLSAAISCIVIFLLYHPLVLHPFALYDGDDYRLFREIRSAQTAIAKEGSDTLDAALVTDRLERRRKEKGGTFLNGIDSVALRSNIERLLPETTDEYASAWLFWTPAANAYRIAYGIAALLLACYLAAHTRSGKNRDREPPSPGFPSVVYTNGAMAKYCNPPAASPGRISSPYITSDGMKEEKELTP